MKTIIYYFTGTGNSLAVARDIAEELHDTVEIVPIAKLIKEESINIIDQSNIQCHVKPSGRTEHGTMQD